MQEKCFDTVIISDLHLGSDLSRAADALEFLQCINFRRLILLGDMFADLNFSRLTKEHWKFLGHIRKLSNPKHGVEVVWVEGNHDHGLTEVMSHLVGISVYQEYAWDYAGKRHLAIHGHQFDSFTIKNFKVTRLGQLIFLWLQKIDSRSKRFARYLDRLNTRWLRLSEQVALGALSHAKQGKAERIFCGHTHAPVAIERDGVEYYNSGAWVGLHCTYITVSLEGVVIHEYLPGTTDNRDPREERVAPAADPAGVAVPAGLSAAAVYENFCS
ncbi:MAG TPA: UDP-2,3-diacylglucosamine diphosphatase [Candidatus Angelobacter sp.]|nr:UDP-2,3-diacylglucosamine diphosphatase [Candidatus Angelobacter sp.]